MVLPCPLPVVGVVHTARRTPDTTPVQSSLNRNEVGVIEFAEDLIEGLDGLEEFDYAWLLTWLHEPSGPAGSAQPPERPELTQVPFLLRSQQREMGVFATRGPRRINPIGLSLVQLLGVDGRKIRFAGVDLIDGTPVLDIKPYVTRFDRAPGQPRCGWFDTVELSDGVTPADL
jgi:tRNA (adenine37-N6)-methyltransferase